jgi:hypothetical protein
LGVRVQENSNYLILKKPQTNELDCIEREVKIDDPRQVKDILKFMGYREVVLVKKERPGLLESYSGECKVEYGTITTGCIGRRFAPPLNRSVSLATYVPLLVLLFCRENVKWAWELG